MRLTPGQQTLADRIDGIAEGHEAVLRGMYWDMDGQEITLGVWAALCERRRETRQGYIGQTFVGDMMVGTIWDGISIYGEGPSGIFETMIFPLDGFLLRMVPDELWGHRWDTLEQARQGHAEAVRMAERAGVAARFWKDERHA